jgi:hypothetical protein
MPDNAARIRPTGALHFFAHRRLMSGKRTKNNDICHRVTADTVTAVDPADHFTRGKRPGSTLWLLSSTQVSVLMVTPPMVWCTPGAI